MSNQAAALALDILSWEDGDGFGFAKRGGTPVGHVNLRPDDKWSARWYGDGNSKLYKTRKGAVRFIERRLEESIDEEIAEEMAAGEIDLDLDDIDFDFEDE